MHFQAQMSCLLHRPHYNSHYHLSNELINYIFFAEIFHAVLCVTKLNISECPGHNLTENESQRAYLEYTRWERIIRSQMGRLRSGQVCYWKNFTWLTACSYCTVSCLMYVVQMDIWSVCHNKTKRWLSGSAWNVTVKSILQRFTELTLFLPNLVVRMVIRARHTLMTVIGEKKKSWTILGDINIFT